MDELFFALCYVCVVSWLLAGWFRIPRYALRFQQAGYSYSRYMEWLSSHRAEKTYFQMFLIGLGVLPFGYCLVGIFTLNFLFQNLLLVTVVYLVGVAFIVYFAPRDRAESVTSTRRTLRLIVIAFVIEIIPIAIGAQVVLDCYALLRDPNNSPESYIVLGPMVVVFAILAVVIAGPAAFILTRYTIPIANLLNRSIDRGRSNKKP